MQQLLQQQPYNKQKYIRWQLLRQWVEVGMPKEQLRQVPRNGIGYGMLHHMNSGEESISTSESSASSHSEILFNYLGQ